MNAEGWKNIIVSAVVSSLYDDDAKLDRLARVLEELDTAKKLLIDAGFSWSGLSLLESVKLAVDASNKKEASVIEANSDSNDEKACIPSMPHVHESYERFLAKNRGRSDG